MEFFIRQGASDPILKLKLIDDGKNNKSSFNEQLLSSEITFEMFNVKTNEYVVLNGQCLLTNRIKKYIQTTEEYYITYRFTSEQTSVKGRYEGTINVQFLDSNLVETNKLILPIQEKLFINVI